MNWFYALNNEPTPQPVASVPPAAWWILPTGRTAARGTLRTALGLATLHWSAAILAARRVRRPRSGNVLPASRQQAPSFCRQEAGSTLRGCFAFRSGSGSGTIDFIRSAFDQEKRTLHDRICSTRVIRNSKGK